MQHSHRERQKIFCQKIFCSDGVYSVKKEDEEEKKKKEASRHTVVCHKNNAPHVVEHS